MSTIREILGGSFIANRVSISNSDGSGTLNLLNQLGASTPSLGTNIYFSAAGNLSLLPTDGFSRSLAFPVNSNRVYTVSDVGTNASFIMSEGTQTINGSKTFTSAISTPNVSGTNTGNVTVSALNAGSNATGATITTPGQVLTLYTADASGPGLMSNVSQVIAGAKTFNNTITTGENLSMPATTSTIGQLLVGNTCILHRAGAASNVFLGNLAGNFTLTGGGNVVVGAGSGIGISSGTNNTIVGQGSGTGISTATGNTIFGQGSCTSALTGTSNVVLGQASGLAMTSALGTTIVGSGSGTGITTAASNTIVGQGACTAALTGTQNVVIGQGTAIGITSATSNVIIGQASCTAALTGATNVVVGQATGTLMTSAANNTVIGAGAATALSTSISNIIIGQGSGGTLATGAGGNILINAAAATATEAATTRIGTSQTSTFIAGISGYNPTANYNLATIDQTGARMGAANMNEQTLYSSTITTNTSTITAITVRGVATAICNPRYVKIGKVMVVTFPNFRVTAQTGTDPNVIFLSTAGAIPAALRPQFASRQVISFLDSPGNEDLIWFINITSAGTVTLVSADPSQNATVTYGMDDTVMVWVCST